MAFLRSASVRTERETGSGRRLDIGLLVALYVAAAAVNLTSVWAASTSLVLTGEEMSVSIRDVLFSVEEGAQASVWSTNFGAPVYYWVASHLDPSYSLFSARRWKAVALALLAPLVFLVLRRRLGAPARPPCSAVSPSPCFPGSRCSVGCPPRTASKQSRGWPGSR